MMLSSRFFEPVHTLFNTRVTVQTPMYHPVLKPGQKSLWMGRWAAAAILGSMVLFSKMSLCKILNNQHL
jgi:ABC-type thiamin/hydroxymethylpyrimidine transport system permease subunit